MKKKGGPKVAVKNQRREPLLPRSVKTLQDRRGGKELKTAGVAAPSILREKKVKEIVISEVRKNVKSPRPDPRKDQPGMRTVFTQVFTISRGSSGKKNCKGQADADRHEK